MRIVVVGAGGFVGGWICEELAQQSDVTVVAQVRRWASAVRVARRGIPIVQADLENPAHLSALLDRADAVVNASMPPPDREASVTSALYHAAARLGVRRFVQFSSAAVYGERTGTVDETVPPAPLDDYSRGKVEMERLLVEAAERAQVPAVILRPSIIYGPFSEAWTVGYVQRVAQGRWRGLGRAGTGICNLIHAHDVARAAMAAVAARIGSGAHVFNINGPDLVTWNEYIERLGDAMGAHARSVPNPLYLLAMARTTALMRAGARAAVVRSLYRRSTGGARDAFKAAQAVTRLYPSLNELKLLRRRVRYAAGRASEALGFTPSVSLEQGIQQSVAWCRLHGVV